MLLLLLFLFFGSAPSFQCWTNFSSTYESVCYFFRYINAFGSYNPFHGFKRVCSLFRFFFSYSSSFLFAFSFMFHGERKMMSTFLEVLLEVALLVFLFVPMFTNTFVKHFELQAKNVNMNTREMDSHRIVAKEKVFSLHHPIPPANHTLPSHSTFPFGLPNLCCCVSHNRFLLHQPTANSC